MGVDVEKETTSWANGSCLSTPLKQHKNKNDVNTKYKFVFENVQNVVLKIFFRFEIPINGKHKCSGNFWSMMSRLMSTEHSAHLRNLEPIFFLTYKSNLIVL